jgi:hypothetical protein
MQILKSLWRTTAFGILSCSVSYFKTPRTSRGRTLSIESMELAVSESELYLDITAAFILKVREGKAGALPALLERDREVESSS